MSVWLAASLRIVLVAGSILQFGVSEATALTNEEAPAVAVAAETGPLVPVAFNQVRGWDEEDHAEAFAAFRQTCRSAVARARRGGPALGRGVAAGLARTCRLAHSVSGRPDRRTARRFFETHFRAYAHASDATGLLTGYYEPVLRASRTVSERFRYPLLRRPSDLIDQVPHTLRGHHDGKLTAGRWSGGSIVPYFTRQEIEEGALSSRGLEFFYLEDPIEAFVLHVQGSGALRLEDGSVVRVHYDGKNGHPYTSIGGRMVAEGHLTRDEVTLESIASWLRADPERGQRMMWENRSYIFFRELGPTEGRKGALGALGAPLWTGRSLAVDAGRYALGLPIFVASQSLHDPVTRAPFARLMVASDVGSAIKGWQRGDIYWGSGEAAGLLAGTTAHQGRFAILYPRGSRPPAPQRP
ncbi:MAG: transglycosylase [Rhizobiales bacterium]|nr:transglycosylase [Hyphomicrobiales bacterium]